MNAQRPLRVACMMIGMIALLTGLWAGLLRLGWPWPPLRSTLPSHHGPLMVSGFLDTLGEGQPRFIAICLLSGALWLAVSGALGLLAGGVMVGPYYDAILHALFLGFVVSMLFGHAPLILPSILNRPVPFQRRFYIHLALLHLSLLLRLVGDLALWWPGRQWGGLLNVVAFLVFLVNTGYAIRTNTSLT